MISCLDLEELIGDYLEERVRVHLRRQVQDHLDGCPQCREFLAAYARTVGVAKAAIRSSSRHAPVSEDLIQSILGALRR